MSQFGRVVSGSSGVGFVQTLTSNNGGAVPPTGNNINVVGAGNITGTGNPGTSTITFTLTGVTTLNYTNVNTSPYVVLPTDEYLSVDCSAIPITLQFPNAATIGRTYIIKDRTGSANINNITVTTVGGAVNIDGATIYTMNTQYSSIELMGNGASYEIF